MRKRNFTSAKFILVLLALAVSLLFIGASYAAAPPTGNVCFSATVTEDTGDPSIQTSTYDEQWTIEHVNGSLYIINGTFSNYPGTVGLLVVTFGGVGQVKGNEMFINAALSAGNATGGLTGVWQITLDFTNPKKITGTYWGIGTVGTPGAPPAYSEFKAGTLTQEKCTK